MEWHQIENFIAVAKHSNFTKAAKERAISQPALSRSIMKLEEELGAPLFLREGKKVKLTHNGEKFLQKAKQAQASIQEGMIEIQENIAVESGEISVAFLHTFGPHFVAKLIAHYKKRFPNVSFKLYQGANDYLITKVQQGLADLCISSPPVPSKGIEWTILGPEPLYIAVPNSHPLAAFSITSFRSLDQENFICLKQGYGLRHIFDRMCTQLEVEPEITFEGEEVATVAGFVSEGLGIALLPKTEELEHFPIRFLQINDYLCQREVAIATLSSYVSPAAKRFKSFVIEYFQEFNQQP